MPRDEAWDTLEPHFETYGLVDMLGIELDYQGENENVITPFALLLVPGRMSLDKARRLGFIEDDFPMGKDHDEDGFDLDGLEEPEGEALNRLMSDDHLQSDHAESHSSERFARDLQSGWVPTRIRRLGSFSSAAYVSDEELVNLVVGTEGDNQVVLQAHASPQHGQAWAEMSLRTSAFLRWNVSWQDGLSAWLEAYDREDVSECRLRIYHLFDSIRGLIALSTGGDGRWLDTLNATCEKSSGEMAHLVGMLRWDGAGVDPETAIREVFDDAVEDYLFLGHGPESESRLLTAMGLRRSFKMS